MCSSSLCSNCWLEDTTLALCANVLITLCFAAMKWLLSQCRYWSVCVGFLQTVVMMMLLGPGETWVSRKGSDLSLFGSSMVNCMHGSCVLMCWKLLAVFPFWMTKVSSTTLVMDGGWGSAKDLDLKLFHKYRWHYYTPSYLTPPCTPLIPITPLLPYSPVQWCHLW